MFFSILVAIALAKMFVGSCRKRYFAIFIGRFQELLGVLYEFLIDGPRDMVLLFRSNNLWESLLLLTCQNVLTFTYRWKRSPRIFFLNLVVNVVFAAP